MIIWLQILQGAPEYKYSDRVNRNTKNMTGCTGKEKFIKPAETKYWAEKNKLGPIFQRFKKAIYNFFRVTGAWLVGDKDSLKKLRKIS